MRRAHAGQTPGNDLAAFGHEAGEQAHVLVVDAVDLLDAELANLLAAEEFPAAFAGTAGTAAGTSARTRSARTAGATSALTWTAAAAFARPAVGTRRGSVAVADRMGSSAMILLRAMVSPIFYSAGIAGLWKSATGALAPKNCGSVSARLKSCPDTTAITPG